MNPRVMQHEKHKRKAPPRGMILILVVTIIVLLAVMGTVYLVVARTDRQAAVYSTSAVNFQLARQAVLNIVREKMLQSTLDSGGNVLGSDTSGPGGMVARDYDFGEQNVQGNPALFNQSNANPSIPSEPWLVADLPWEPYSLYVYGSEVVYDNNRYICISNNLKNAPGSASPSADAANWKALSGRSGPSFFSELAPDLYDPKTGAFDIAIGAPGTPPVPDASTVDYNGHLDSPTNTVGTLDGIYNLLPFSGVSGVRYRYSVYITDTNAMANLNVGNVGGTADPFGSALADFPLTNSAIFGTDTGNSLQSSGSATMRGRQGYSAVAYGGANFGALWQAQALRMEKPTDTGLQWFDLSDELELRSYGGVGSGFLGYNANYECRPEVLWPNTLGPGAPYRNFYTTYSWDRTYATGAVAPLAPQYTLDNQTSVNVGPTGGYSELVWPFPRQIALNPEVPPPTRAGTPTDFGPVQVALTATSLASAMGTSDYPQQQAAALAANDAAYRFDGGLTVTEPNGTNAYALPIGPSFIDNQGFCVRGEMAGGASGQSESKAQSQALIDHESFTGAGDVKTLLPPGVTLPMGVAATTTQPLVMAGFSAQPFINEVAAVVTAQTGGTIAFNNCAVELYNPFPVALDLTGWKLKVYTPADPAHIYSAIIDLGKLFPNGIGPGQYAVVEQSAQGFQAVPAAAASAVNAALVFAPGAGDEVVLTRPFYPRGTLSAANAPAQDLPVDAFDYSDFLDGNHVPPTAIKLAVSIQRSNAAPFQCASAADAFSPAPTLGMPNTQPVSPAIGIPLYDRFATVGTPLEPGAPLINIGDFNRITRLASISALATKGGDSDWVPVETLSMLIANLTKNTAEPNPLLQYEAAARFDWLYAPPTPVDPGAQNMLGLITMIDRADNPRVDVGGGPTDMSKVRIPGRINVNTAPVAVLAALFSAQPPPVIAPEAVPSVSVPGQLVADVEAFRDRSAFTYQPPGSTPYSANFVNDPGLAIANMGQLLYAISAGGPTPKSPPLTLDQRDQSWAAAYNMATVRSDTFIVYGYLEALKKNPNQYAPAHDNRYDWYDGSISDDPTNGSASAAGAAQNIRVGKERFVAIVDRSVCNLGRGESGAGVGDANAKFQLPRVVALKVLPK